MKNEVLLQLTRGESSWAYFPIAYNIFLTLTVGIISVLPVCILEWQLKILLILLFAILYFYLSFYNDWFRNKVVGVFMKSAEHVETKNGK
jgi:glucan phosphoethanolaminetransferase (alkaline phosphatase superfamily)